jgi:DUF4097 and DUF4098 domain-containing protein YvlB
MKLKRHTQLATVLVFAAITAMPMLAQNSRVFREGNAWVEEITGSLPQVRNLKVVTEIGSINVNGGSNNEITYTIRKRSNTSSEDAARRAFQQFSVSATRRGDYAVFEGSSEGGRGRRFDVQFILNVPRDLAFVKLASDGGGINVRSISGKLEAETGGGSVKLDDLGGFAVAETGGGSIEVGNSNGELKLTTGGGSIKVTSAKGRVMASSGGGSVWIGKAAAAMVETGGGSVDVDTCTGETKVDTGGGGIALGKINGPVTLETGGGSIRLAGASGPVRVSTGGGSLELMSLAQGVRAETGAGSITVELVGSPVMPSSLETSAGDIVVYVAPDAKLDVKAVIDTAFGHKIESELAGLNVTSEGGQWGPKTISATGKLNGGGQMLTIETTIGNIFIRKAKR